MGLSTFETIDRIQLTPHSHLVNEGVEETPPSKSVHHTSSNAAASHDPNQLFAHLDDANVGFKHWHPMPVTQNGNKLCGLAEMGGLWEWTSSALEKVKGFEPMKLYPAYSGQQTCIDGLRQY